LEGQAARYNDVEAWWFDQWKWFALDSCFAIAPMSEFHFPKLPPLPIMAFQSVAD
jgi:hypothetical protein